MADDTKQKSLIASVRDSLSDAYGFVRGAQFTKQTAHTTYEQLADQAIARIRGTEGVTTTRPCKLDRIQAVKDNLTTAVKALQDTPVDAWVWGTGQDVADKDKANTPENG